MVQTDDSLRHQPPEPAGLPEIPALPAAETRDPAKTQPAGGASALSSGVTLAEALLSPLEEFAALLGGALTRPAAARPARTIAEWAQQGLPAFPFPEDIRGSFMDHVI